MANVHNVKWVIWSLNCGQLWPEHTKLCILSSSKPITFLSAMTSGLHAAEKLCYFHRVINYFHPSSRKDIFVRKKKELKIQYITGENYGKSWQLVPKKYFDKSSSCHELVLTTGNMIDMCTANRAGKVDVQPKPTRLHLLFALVILLNPKHLKSFIREVPMWVCHLSPVLAAALILQLMLEPDGDCSGTGSCAQKLVSG